MRAHKLRTDPVPFQDVWKNRQTFQIRPDDDFEVGDVLILQETMNDTESPQAAVIRADYSGREIHCEVSHIMRGPRYGLMAGWVCMSIAVFFKVSTNADSR